MERAAVTGDRGSLAMGPTAGLSEAMAGAQVVGEDEPREPEIAPQGLDVVGQGLTCADRIVHGWSPQSAPLERVRARGLRSPWTAATTLSPWRPATSSHLGIDAAGAVAEMVHKTAALARLGAAGRKHQLGLALAASSGRMQLARSCQQPAVASSSDRSVSIAVGRSTWSEILHAHEASWKPSCARPGGPFDPSGHSHARGVSRRWRSCRGRTRGPLFPWKGWSPASPRDDPPGGHLEPERDVRAFARFFAHASPLAVEVCEVGRASRGSPATVARTKSWTRPSMSCASRATVLKREPRVDSRQSTA
jgi:hypothetical protein